MVKEKVKCLSRQGCGPRVYLCCHECKVKDCWQRCKDDLDTCIYRDLPEKAEETVKNTSSTATVLYVIVNKISNQKLYKKGNRLYFLSSKEVNPEYTLVKLPYDKANRRINKLTSKYGEFKWGLERVKG